MNQEFFWPGLKKYEEYYTVFRVFLMEEAEKIEGSGENATEIRIQGHVLIVPRVLNVR